KRRMRKVAVMYGESAKPASGWPALSALSRVGAHGAIVVRPFRGLTRSTPANGTLTQDPSAQRVRTASADATNLPGD
ncbi:hypothetical protein AB0K24_46645, partial [Streptomyces mirabilis]|uniref:hypothetical protein n=1 Tax=Streptomyces mirabilis TaxID=68239 RepID=UPI003413041C